MFFVFIDMFTDYQQEKTRKQNKKRSGHPWPHGGGIRAANASLIAFLFSLAVFSWIICSNL